MKRHCGLGLFLIVGGACLLNLTANIRAQTNGAQMPSRIAASVVVPPTENLDDYLKFDAEAKMVSVTNGTDNHILRSASRTFLPGTS